MGLNSIYNLPLWTPTNILGSTYLGHKPCVNKEYLIYYVCKMEHVQNYSFNIKCETIKWLKLLYPCGRWGYVEIVHKGNVIDISSYSTKYNKWLVNSAPCLPLSQLNTYKGHCSGWMNQKVDSLCRIGSRHERISSRISECLKTKTIEQDVDKTSGPGGWRRPRPGKWKLFIFAARYLLKIYFGFAINIFS